jgi:hypothetical protein
MQVELGQDPANEAPHGVISARDEDRRTGLLGHGITSTSGRAVASTSAGAVDGTASQGRLYLSSSSGSFGSKDPTHSLDQHHRP